VLAPVGDDPAVLQAPGIRARPRPPRKNTVAQRDQGVFNSIQKVHGHPPAWTIEASGHQAPVILSQPRQAGAKFEIRSMKLETRNKFKFCPFCIEFHP
jgi:hypothetical protein